MDNKFYWINMFELIFDKYSDKFIDKLKKRTIDRNLFSLLGGLPLVISDELNSISEEIDLNSLIDVTEKSFSDLAILLK